MPKTNKMGVPFVRIALLALSVALVGGVLFGGDADRLRDIEASCAEFEGIIWRSRKCVLDAAERGYADAYRDDPRPVWKVGCNYNPETRNLDKPAIARA